MRVGDPIDEVDVLCTEVVPRCCYRWVESSPARQFSVRHSPEASCSDSKREQKKTISSWKAEVVSGSADKIYVVYVMYCNTY